MQAFSGDLHSWIGDMDSELDAKFYIMPLWGDTGGLSHGEKL